MATTKNNKTKELIETLEKGILEVFDSQKYKEYLKVQSMFHNYSSNNVMLIFLQKPTATVVAGYKTWQKLGRQVQKGEKGISILAPCPYKYKKEVEVIDPETKKPIKEVKIVEGLRFKKVSVFDISQTEGKELPSLTTEIKTNSEKSRMVISAIKEISEVPILFEDIKGGAKGYFSPIENKIVIKNGMSQDQTVKTLIHEYTHSQLHGMKNPLIDRATAEVQAESVAFIVSNRYGIDTSEYSFNYLASWSSGKDLKELKNSLDIIQKVSNDIVEKIDKVLEKELELQKENSMENNPFDKDMADPFKDIEKFKKDLEERRSFIRELITGKDVIKLGNNYNTDYVILHPSVKGSNYQLTYFVNNEPISDAQFDTLDEVVERLQQTGFAYKLEEGEINIKEKIIKQYRKEFPAIKFISKSGAEAINEINNSRNKYLSIDEIKAEYKKIGQQLENNNSQLVKDKFEIFENVINELKQAQLNFKEEQSKEKVKAIELNKEKSFEMVE